MAEWVKLWTTFHDDPTIQNLSAAAIVYYVNALSWCGRHDSEDGTFHAIGKPPRCVAELVKAGKFVELEPGVYQIHAFGERQNALRQLADKRREAGRLGGQASGRSRRSKAEASASSNGEATPSRFGEADKRREEEKEPSPDRSRAPGADDLCELLADLVEGNGSKRPTVTQRWRDEADRMLRIDKRSLDEATALLRWSQADPFWCSNVMSMVKFRAQYDTLRLRRQSGTNGHSEDLPDPHEVLA